MSEPKKTVRILHITFNMGFGGTEQVIRQLVSGLSSASFKNYILCIDGNVGEIGERVRKEGVNVEAIRRSPGFDIGLIGAIRDRIRNLNIDVVHCHQYTPWVYGWMASRFTRARVVFTEHGRFHPDRYRPKAVVINPIMALTTDFIVAISSATRGALARYEFIPRWKIEVIYNGIRGLGSDESAVTRLRKELNIREGDLVLGTVARLDPVKNQSMMLKAFAGVIEQNPNTWLLMVGDGPDRQALEQQASELDIGNRVIFTGFQSEPSNYLAAMDIFLLSSHTEGTSMTLLEAMSLGIPAITTSVGGNPEIVDDGKTGMLVPADDPESLAAAIHNLLNAETVRVAMGETAHGRFESRFSIASMVDGYQTLYLQLVRG